MMKTPTRPLVVCVAVGCLLGAVTVATISPVAGAHAISAAPPASATSEGVEGYDAQQYPHGGAYGNRALVEINGPNTIGSLHDAIARSLFVLGNTQPFSNWVEVGWTAHNGGHNNPTVYAEWTNLGAEDPPQFYTGYHLTDGGDTVFTVVNLSDRNFFRFYVDSKSNSFNTSPTMNFNYGWLLTNSERYDTRDSLFAHFRGLNWYDYNDWTKSYEDLECYTTESTGWKFIKISNSEQEVNQSGGVTC